MQISSTNATLLPAPRPRVDSGRSPRLPGPDPEAQQQLPESRAARQYATSQAEVVDSLRRFAQLRGQAEPQDGRTVLPLRSRQALDAYVETRREEERAFLHDVMGVDIFA
ncbi:MAG: hypothetical protein HND59_14055 [Pseudomonadota bacterium]|nr:MAG: hypothetical protein HND59_14055 [Pseudomonadota bacterium]